MGFYLKDPASSIDYTVDWGAGYLDGQTIAASSWRVEPQEAGGLVAEASATGSGRTIVTLAKGRSGRVYRVVNKVTLSDGRSDERTVSIRVDER